MVQQIRLAELVSALSYALDLTEGQPAGHSVRACWIGVHLGQAIGLDPAAISDLYYTLLLKDAGCSSTAARICQLYVTDDLRFKRDLRLTDTTLPQVLRFFLSHSGMGAGLAERFRVIVQNTLKTGEIAQELVNTRCHRGADIALQMRFPTVVADGILDLDEHWDGRGLPEAKSGEAIALYSRIALMAQVADVFFMSVGPARAEQEVAKRSGSWFEPRLADAFAALCARPGFWADLADPMLERRLLALEPDGEARIVDDGYLDDIAAAFARVIDAKSPFTGGHSDRVALFSDLIATEFGFDGAERSQLKRAALLHDIGKLGVSNAVLDKPGKLTDAEFDEIKRHPAMSELILSRVAAFADLARIAGAHHERLDGKGYPRGLTGDEIGPHTRIITVADIFDALTADRPYRDAMPVARALGIMDDMVGTAIDARCLAALKAALVSAAGDGEAGPAAAAA